MSEPMSPTPPPGPPSGPPPAAPPPGGPPYSPPPGGPPATSRPGLPWERGKSFASLVETIKRLIVAPTEAFAEMREKGDYASPLIFAVIIGWVGAIFSVLWQTLFGGAWMSMMPAEYRREMGPMMASQGFGLVIWAVLAPIFVIIAVFIGAAIYHLFLMLFGGHRDSTAGFEGTFRVVCYAAVANLAGIVPFVGSFVAVVWSVVLLILGLSSVHRTTSGKAALAVLVPWLLCCVCIALSFASIVAAIAGMAGAMNH